MALFKKKKSEEKLTQKPIDRKTADVKDEKKSTPAKIEKKKAVPKKESMRDLYATDTKAQVATGKKGKKAVRIYGNAHRVLVKPLVTEKAANLGSDDKYVFAVSRSANKIEIMKAIKEVYGIKPISVNIIKVRGKRVRYGRTFGQRKDWKKAIITLPSGKSINIYEGV